MTYKHISTGNIFDLNSNTGYYETDIDSSKLPKYIVENNEDFVIYEYQKNYVILQLIDENDVVIDYLDEIPPNTSIYSVKRTTDNLVFKLFDVINNGEIVLNFYHTIKELRLQTFNSSYSIDEAEYGVPVVKKAKCEIHYLQNGIEKKYEFWIDTWFELDIKTWRFVKLRNVNLIRVVDHFGRGYVAEYPDHETRIIVEDKNYKHEPETKS